jgi:Methyltransferase domain
VSARTASAQAAPTEAASAGGVLTRFVYRHEDRRPFAFEPIYRSFEPSLYVPQVGAHGFLSLAHEAIPAEVEKIYGKLSPGDQYKLYEAAYFARGPILEIGRLHGKSTVVLALGLRDGGANVPFYSLEIQDKHMPIAEGHLRDRGLHGLVTLLQGDSAATIADLPGRFDTVFVDGEHSYEGVMRDLRALEGRIEPGGVAMFHDCFHPANATGVYGVARALEERAEATGLAYRGRFGGIALYEQLGRLRRGS